MKKVVLHLLSSNRFSGAENVACQIIKGIEAYSKSNIRSIYCSIDGPIRQILLDKNVEFIPIMSASISEVRKVVKTVNPNIIHAHDMRAGLLASISSFGIPIISHIHNNNFDSRGLSVKSLAYLLAGLKSNHIFWVSESSFKGYYFHKFLSYKSSILRNVIDVNILYEKVKEDFNEYNYDIIYLGRLSYPKNPQRLVLVLERVVRILPNAKIAIIGDGEFREEVLEMISSRGLGSNINYLGYQQNPYKILSSSKVMLMTSRWEGLPMCSIEAMSLGVPLVSTPTDGLKEIIDNGIDGILSDDDEIIVQSIVEILTDQSVHGTMSVNARDKAIRLMDINRYILKILDIYSGC